MNLNLKTVTVAACLSLALPGALFAAEKVLVDPQSDYAKAVKSYVDAATDQLQAVRNSVDTQLKTATDQVRARFKKAYDGLERSDKLLEQLKSAVGADFDRIKAEFERVRAQAFKELDEARKI